MSPWVFAIFVFAGCLWVYLRCHIIGFICFNDSKTISITTVNRFTVYDDKTDGWCPMLVFKSNNMTNCWDSIFLDAGSLSLSSGFSFNFAYNAEPYVRKSCKTSYKSALPSYFGLAKNVIQNWTRKRKKYMPMLFFKQICPNPFYLLRTFEQRIFSMCIRQNQSEDIDRWHNARWDGCEMTKYSQMCLCVYCTHADIEHNQIGLEMGK